MIFDRAMQSHSVEFIAGVGEALVECGSELSVAPLASGSEERDVEACDRLVKSGRIDAAILCAPVTGDHRLMSMQEQGLPCLLFGRASGYPLHAWLDIDTTALTRRAVDYLISLAHRRIAMINAPSDQYLSGRREAGYRQALHAAAISYDPEIIANGDLTETNGFLFTRAFLNLPTRPTAIVTGTTESALGIYRAARSCSLIVGRDLSVVAHDDRLAAMRAEHMDPVLTSTRASLRCAGRRAGELVLKLIAGQPADTVHEEWRAEFFVGKSSCQYHDQADKKEGNC
ncbi:substrate-binding domain-containing protein [Ensifer adhaerens]|uniref:substrate-binding domain-containing protein n=1 Tax=Ensifer adhaerens TaxID=106592 RepID=UPI0031F37A7D